MTDKELLGRTAAGYAGDGMLVGLGTGSTADCFIEALAARVREGLRIEAVASSPASAALAQRLGLPLVEIDQLSRLDLYVDGADEVSPARDLLKGRGADLVKEKLLASASARFLVLIERSKLVERLGQNFPIPVEVLPFAARLVTPRLEALGGRCELRRGPQGGPALTSQGNIVLDVRFPPGVDVPSLDTPIRHIPGVAEHGIFRQLASLILLGEGGAVQELSASTAPR
jgi:ribose 5-phosphate isomerase A